MAKTTEKGEVGEAMVIADLIRQGHDVAIPFGHNQPFDLIVVRKEDGRLEKVQVKYRTSNGRTVKAPVRSTSARVEHRYPETEVDWIALVEGRSGQCFYLSSSIWSGHTELTLRLAPSANSQVKRIRWASDFAELTGSPRDVRPGTGGDAHLQLPLPPE